VPKSVATNHDPSRALSQRRLKPVSLIASPR
jgi:hypothetical protein